MLEFHFRPYQAFSEFADIKIIKYEDMEKTYSKRAEEKEIKRVRYNKSFSSKFRGIIK